MLFDMVYESNVQGSLLILAAQEKNAKRTTLMKSLKINTVHGRHTIHYAIEGVGEQRWYIKQKNRSPRQTTDWNELAIAHCNY